MDQDHLQLSPRSTGDSPFCWASKEALRQINKHFAESNKVPTALSVYIALCVIASDQRKESFVERIATIAGHAGISYKTALQYLQALEEAQFVKIERAKVPGSKLDAPSTYTLLAVQKKHSPLLRSETPLCTDGRTSPTTEKSEESVKKPSKKSNREQRAVDLYKDRFPSDVIDLVYNAYPKRPDSVRTRSEDKAIRKALEAISEFESDPVEFLMERVQGYARFCAAQPPRFKKCLMNYMRDEHYSNNFCPLRS